MANKKISELPFIEGSKLSGNTLVPLVTYFSAATGDTVHTFVEDLQTYLISGLTGNTDVFVTGGTYSAGTITLTNNTGGTFNVTGLTTGSTSIISGEYLPLSGGTVTGDTVFTQGISANTISATTYLNLPISTDIFVTGGTYSNGDATFTNNTGGTFNVTGFYTGETSYVNSLTTGVGLSADTTTGDITIINTDPDQVVVLNNGTNINVTGTYPNFTIYVTGLTDFNTFTTGFTYNNNTFTISDNSGSTFNATFTDVTGLTVNGNLNITGTTYSNVISATTYQNLPITTDVFVTGGTYSNGDTTFTNNTGGTFSVSGFVTGDTYVTGLTFNTGNYNLTIGRNDGVSFTDSLAILASDLTVTGGTYDPNTGTATFTNNTGGTFNVTGFLTGFTDTFVTGGTYSNGTATFTNTSGGTFNVSGFYTGDTTIITGATSVGTGITIFDSVIDRDIKINSITGDTLEKITTSLSANTIQVGINEQNLTLWPLVVNGNRLIDGSVSYVSGLTFDISPLNYIIDGSLYSIPSSTQVTLNSGDSTFDRIDVIFADISGNTGVLEGTPSANPEKPIVDSETQVEVTFVSVPANSTTPTISTELIYDEFTGEPTEWNFLKFGNQTFRISGDSTAQSYSGSKSISVSGLTTSGGSWSNGFVLSSTTLTDTNQFATLQFAIRNMSGNSNNTQIRIRFLNQIGSAISSPVYLWGSSTTGQYVNYSAGNTSSWQLISIPLWKFYLTNTNVYGVRFDYAVGSTVARHYFDKIELVEGTASSPPSNSWTTIKGDSTTTITAPNPNATLTISGGTNIGSFISGTSTVVLNLDNNINLNGVSANTISATTYQNLPTDVSVTGGTYNSNTGTATFTNNTGGTFNVTGFITGLTDTYVTGGTYSNGTATFTNTSGGTFNVTGFTQPFSGGSGNCIADLYVTNIHGCSPITIYDSVKSTGSTVSGSSSFSFGFETSATTDYSFAIGYQTLSSNIASNAEGFNTVASNTASHAEGLNTIASGYGSHAEGASTESSGLYSHAEGGGGLATNLYSHAEGRNTQALGQFSHAEGDATVSRSAGSHSEGRNTDAKGEYSHTEGHGTIADGNYQHVTGLFNITGNTTEGAFIIGNGTSNSNRSNLLVAGNSGVTVYGNFTANTISATTYQNLPDNVTGRYLPLSGGTVTGGTIFQSGLTANTISADTLTITNNIDSTSRLLYDSGGNIVVDWENLELSDNTNVSINWTSRILQDNLGELSIDWQNRKVYKSGGTLSFDWENGILTGQTNIQSSTISATTYQNLPISGLSEGNNINISGSNGNYTISVTGITQGLTGDYLPLSGGTVTGGTIFTQGLTANTLNVTGDTNINGNLVVSGNSGINWFSSNTSSDLVRITQTGTGNAFVVEDNTNPDSSPFIINSGGSVSIGTTNVFSVGAGTETKLNVSTGSSGLATTGLSVSTPVVIESAAGTSIGLFNPDVANSQIYFGTPSDPFGSFLRWDYTNRNFILSTANSTGKLIFQTANAVEVARIDQSGNMGIGLTGATQKLEVSGNTRIYGTLSADTISATTYQNLPDNVTGRYLPLSGGTVTGNTIFTSGLTANTLNVTGNTNVRSFTGTTGYISGSGQNILTVIGSGNSTTSPLFSVQGSSGELFSVSDSLVGSLFSVNDISGLPIVEVFSDNTTLWGSYQAPSLNTTTRTSLSAGTNTIYSIPTSGYTGAFYEYTLISTGSTGARAGQIMSIWSGSTAQFTETKTTDIGTTTGVTFTVAVSGNNAVLSSSATTAGWTVKTIIRSI